MDSYFAMLWDPKCSRASRHAGFIRERISDTADKNCDTCDADGVFALDYLSPRGRKTSLAIPTEHGFDRGVIFGRLFHRDDDENLSRAVISLSRTEGEAIFQSGGRSLLSNYWGNYVAILRRENARQVLASPTSSLPCFFLEQHGVVCVFSHLERCKFLDRTRLTIDYSFVKQLLVYDKIQNGRTGFNEVKELIGGARITVTEKGTMIDTLWDPRDDAAFDRFDPARAPTILKDTVDSVVASWASRYDNVAVDLSGGLDSSIVLSSLVKARGASDVKALHHFLTSQDAKEMAYAKASADFHGVELAEVRLGASDRLPDISQHPPSVRPYRQFLEHDSTKRLANDVTELADVFFTGQGGDHLFYMTKSPLVFIDHLKNRGISPDLPHQLLSASRLSGQSVWGVLALLPTLFQSEHMSDLLADIGSRSTRINKPAFEDFDTSQISPEWVLGSKGLPPAKFNQVGHLMHLFQIRKPFHGPQHRNLLHPLISQPLIELCLAIPTYELARGGVNRGLVRDAFTGAIPDRVRTRVSKGSATQYFMQFLSFNKDCVIAALTEGELASEGLISTADVLAFFESRPKMLMEEARALFQAYFIEAWLRVTKSMATVTQFASA